MSPFTDEPEANGIVFAANPIEVHLARIPDGNFAAEIAAYRQQHRDGFDTSDKQDDLTARYLEQRK